MLLYSEVWIGTIHTKIEDCLHYHSTIFVYSDISLLISSGFGHESLFISDILETATCLKL